jgi:hypothetical protein
MSRTNFWESFWDIMGALIITIMILIGIANL